MKQIVILLTSLNILIWLTPFKIYSITELHLQNSRAVSF